MPFRLILAIILLSTRISWAAEEPIDVSLVQLIATPERYDGKLVRCIGFLRLEFEGNVLYLHREDYEQRLFKNGLWFDVPNGPAEGGEPVESLNLHYVLVEATFNASAKGHMGLSSGSLKNVRRLRGWEWQKLLPAR